MNTSFVPASFDSSWQPSPRYPDPRVVTLDDSFSGLKLAAARVERISHGHRWCEGPVWWGDARCLLWSDIPNDRIYRWDEVTSAVRVVFLLKSL